MKPVVKVIQTAKNEKQAWRKLDDLELFKYYNFRMNTVSVDSSISYQKLLGFGGDRKSTRLNSSHPNPSRMPSSA